MLPQLPVLEQQLPNPEPTHVLPLEPHFPSVEIVPLPLLQVPKPDRQPAPQWAVVLPHWPLDEQQVPKAEPVHVLPLVPHTPSVEMVLLPLLQVPNPDWHPASQWAVVLPQFPVDEQQLPKPEPVHVLPLEPHLPSVEMLPLPLLQVPKADWHPAPQWTVVPPQ